MDIVRVSCGICDEAFESGTDDWSYTGHTVNHLTNKLEELIDELPLVLKGLDASLKRHLDKVTEAIYHSQG